MPKLKIKNQFLKLKKEKLMKSNVVTNKRMRMLDDFLDNDNSAKLDDFESQSTVNY